MVGVHATYDGPSAAFHVIMGLVSHTHDVEIDDDVDDVDDVDDNLGCLPNPYLSRW